VKSTERNFLLLFGQWYVKGDSSLKFHSIPFLCIVVVIRINYLIELVKRCTSICNIYILKLLRMKNE